MTDPGTDRPDHRFTMLARDAANPVTMLGAAVTTVTGVLVVVFLVAEIMGWLHNPYIGIFAYLVLPAWFVLGLLSMPIGVWRERRRRRRSGELPEDARWPRFDLNEPRTRRLVFTVGVLTVVNAILLGAASFLAVESMETVEFCGQVCHEVMQPEYTAYQESPHSRVACVECHIGPGASWFVRSKLDGLRQVWHTTFDTFHRPIQTPLETLRPARETCEQCHWPGKHFGDKLRVFARFRSDEANTPRYSVMLLKTGGGSLDLGRHGGIHWWHIESDNRIRFVTGDERRQEVVWVELTTPTGAVLTYTRDGEELPDAAELRRQARTMDCIDCHNRPTHLFQVPSRSVDALLEAEPGLRDLPYSKREAVAAITGDYPSHGAGMDAVRESVAAFYSTEYPSIARERRELVDRAAAAAAEIYGRTVFPAMQTDWTTHPNHIGHEDFPGCFRCHDGEMSTAGGERTIPLDCETCHVFVVEDSPDRPDLDSLVL